MADTEHLSIEEYMRWRGLQPTQINKYRNKPVVVDGVRFDSKGEYNRWAMLKLMVESGQYGIASVERQQMVDLVVNDVKVCSMRLDFKLTYDDGRVVYEDFKGFITAEWSLKKKLYEALNPGQTIRISGEGER